MMEMKGVIPALTTPFKDDQSLDLDGFQALVDLVIEDGVHALVPNGCTGESWALDDDERLELFKAAVEASNGRVPVIPGCGDALPKKAIAKVRQAEAAGCDGVMIQPPWYVMPGEEEIHDYFKAILDATELPVMLYNIPRRTGICMSVDLVSRLADEPKVVAIKESSKDWMYLSAVIRTCRDRINILVGYFQYLGLAGFAEGAVGYVDSTTPVVGKMSLDFYDAVTGGDIEKARTIQVHLAALNKSFFGYGTFPSATKAALDMLGRPGGRTRDPIRPLGEADKAKIRAALESAGLLESGLRAAE